MTMNIPTSQSRNAPQFLGLSGSGKRSLHVPGQVWQAESCPYDTFLFDLCSAPHTCAPAHVTLYA